MTARRRLAVFGALFAFAAGSATVAGEQAAAAHWWSSPTQAPCSTIVVSYAQYGITDVLTYCSAYSHEGGEEQS